MARGYGIYFYFYRIPDSMKNCQDLFHGSWTWEVKVHCLYLGHKMYLSVFV